MNEQEFLKDIEKHQMEVIRDDGVYRHIRFKRPGSYCYGFDFITWPGHLCYTGDMGTYVFSRLHDMFEFFRADHSAVAFAKAYGRSLYINLPYWAEKVLSPDRHDGIKEFSAATFNRVVLEHLMTWIREHRDCTTKEERRELWDAVMDEVVQQDDGDDGSRRQAAANDFRHHVNDRAGRFEFQDFWDHNVEDYTQRFTWCCYALAWGVQQYDAAVAAKAA